MDRSGRRQRIEVSRAEARLLRDRIDVARRALAGTPHAEALDLLIAVEDAIAVTGENRTSAYDCFEVYVHRVVCAFRSLY